MAKFNSKNGVALIMTVIITLVASIYLSSYVIWAIWDQRNLARQHIIEQADELALSGLNRATLDLSLDTDSWLDGNINGHAVNPPNAGNPNAFYVLYNGTANETLANGNYSVEIRYLFNAGTARFYDKRMWIRSTGITSAASRVLQQLFDIFRVRNLTRGINYTSLQTAVNEALNNEAIGIADVTLNENVTVSPAAAMNYNITGCWNNDFSNRSCGNYHSRIQGRVNALGNATLFMTGVTIE